MPCGLLLPYYTAVRCGKESWQAGTARVAPSAPKSTLRHEALAMSSAGSVANVLFHEKGQVFQGWSHFRQE